MADDGVPIINTIIPNEAASRAGALKEGERILAVSDADGAWLDSRSLAFEDLINLIRGAPNTSVSLRLQPQPGDAARTVTLTRQQIINKR